MTDSLTDIRPHELAVPLPDAFDAQLWFIGRIRTPWTKRSDCPHRGDPVNGPECRVVLDDRWRAGLTGIDSHDQIQLLYWMHLSRRDLMLQNPGFRDFATGTFALRSPVRPNPVASSTVKLLRVEGVELVVRGLDCIDGTAVIDIKAECGPMR